MNLIILGPSGSGKGTQARLLCDKLKLAYISMGDLLRDAARTRKDIDEWINKKGELVPDEITFSVLKEHLEKNKVYDNLLFDGYPRSIRQYNLLKSYLESKGVKLDMAIFLAISDEEAVRRLSARRIDVNTGEIYNLITEPPPQNIQLDNLVHRDDDKPEAIKRRLEWYEKETFPLIKLLGEQSVLIKVDGEQPIKTIFKTILERVGDKK